MNILEKQFKDGTFLKVVYEYATDYDGVCDLEVISANLYNKDNEMIENTLSTAYISQIIIDNIDDSYDLDR